MRKCERCKKESFTVSLMCDECIDEVLKFDCFKCGESFKGRYLGFSKVIDDKPVHTCCNCAGNVIIDNDIQF